MQDNSPATIGKRKRRWFVASLLILVVIGEAGRRSWPAIRREIDFRTAQQALEAGRLDEAEARLNGWIAADPRDTRGRLALVEVYRRQGRITDAEETLQRAVELGLPIEKARAEHNLLRADQRPAIDNPQEKAALADR